MARIVVSDSQGRKTLDVTSSSYDSVDARGRVIPAVVKAIEMAYANDREFQQEEKVHDHNH